jgi:hypothetical protein
MHLRPTPIATPYFHLCQVAFSPTSPKFLPTSKIQEREKEKGIHFKRRVKLAAKLLVIAWTLMKKKEPFNPAYLKAELS